GRAQKAEAVLQDLEHAVAVDVLALARMRLEYGEDDVLLARAGHVLEAHGLGELDQVADRTGLELRQVHGAARLRQLGGADDFSVIGAVDDVDVHRLFGLAAVATVAVAIAAVAAFGPVAALITEI